MDLRKRAVWSIVVVLYVTTGSLSVVMTGEQIRISVDYVAKFREMVKPAAYDPNINARSYYDKALAAVVDYPKELERTDYDIWIEDLSVLKQRVLRDWIGANEQALAALSRATALPYYVPRYEGDFLYAVEYPDMGRMRRLSYACCTRARLRVKEGQLQEAFDDVLMCYRMGQKLGGPKTLVEQLVGFAVRAKAMGVCLEILARIDIDAKLLGDVQAGLETLVDRDSSVSFAAERLVMHDLIQRTFTDDGTGGGRFPSNPGTALKDQPTELWLYNYHSVEQDARVANLDRRETAKLVDQVMDFMDSMVDKSPAYWRNMEKNPNKVLYEMVKDNVFVAKFLPAGKTLVELDHRAKAEAGALLVILELLRYKADEGRFPVSLEQLAGTKYIKALPIDPYTDRPLVYKQTEDSFLLYSFGADFDDDGGTHSKWGQNSEGGDQVFWPVQTNQ